MVDYDGEIWHLFDTRYKTLITKIDVRNINRVNLSKYSILFYLITLEIKCNINRLKDFLSSGGNLIVYKVPLLVKEINWYWVF